MTLPKPPLKATKLPGGWPKIIQIADDLRGRNSDGYLPAIGGILANIKGHQASLSKGTTCSPFTATVIGVAFDPTYPRDDLKGDAYVPLCNEGKDPMKYPDFYHEHNTVNDNAANAVAAWGLGELIEAQDLRRGDLVEIGWQNDHGHAVFCWDVHLDEHGKVDCIQILGSHGGHAGDTGVSIWGCSGKPWLEGGNPKQKNGTGNYAKLRKQIFVDEDEIVRQGWWLVLPEVKASSINLDTFRVRPRLPLLDKGNKTGIWAKKIRAAHFHYDGAKAEPYSMKGGAASSVPASAPGHIDAPVTTIKGNDIKKDPAAPAKVQPKPVKQDEKKPLNWQHDVERAMQDFFKAQWIKSDPGSSDNINDAKSQAAIKEFQTLFKLLVDGIVGKQTKGAIAKQLPACHRQAAAQEMLGKLYRGKKLGSDPGGPDGTNNSKTQAAVKDFQKANGLAQTGVPDADTLAKLEAAVADHAPSASKHGLEPRLTAAYWLGNSVAPGGTATLRVHSHDLKTGFELRLLLKDIIVGNDVESTVKLAVTGEQSQVAVPMPKQFVHGSMVVATLKATLEDGTKLEQLAAAPLFVLNEPIKPAPAPVAAGDLEIFFKFKGTTGERETPKDHLYVAYKVPGKPQAWFIKGRFMTDVDGAPNCYHPDNLNVRTDYLKFDLLQHKGALDWRANGGKPGNWFGVVTDTGEKTGTPIVQGDNDPCPGFYVSSTSLSDSTKKRNDPRRYVDARVIPYIAFPGQVYNEGAQGTRFTRVTKGPTGRLGDFLTVVNPDADEAHRYTHAIFADMGGFDDPHFGEGSPALGQKVHAAGLVEAKLLYILYPHSGAGPGKIPTADEVRQKGEELFKQWGGMDEVKRVLPLMK
jgi:peptidoglycan hydrolase-like protein with peptidoglycan-binding domain